MSMTSTGGLAPAGHNEGPDRGKLEAERLAAEYRELTNDVADLLAEADKLPERIDDDPTVAIVGRIIKRMRDLTGRIAAHHVAEKEPHLRAGQAVDGFFFAMWERIAKRGKTGKPGVADELQARVDDYAQRKHAEELQKRLAAEEAARKERAAALEREQAERRRVEDEQRKAQEAEAAAARARKAANVEAHQDRAAAHEDAAAVAAEQAERERVAGLMAADKHDQARITAAAKPADMVRTRAGDDVMMTMKREPFVEIVDGDALDAAKLWPFVRHEHKLAALKAWAKTTEHKVAMAGAIIEMRNRGVIR